MVPLPAVPVLNAPVDHVGRQQSILHPGFVGAMRKLGFAMAISAGAAAVGVGYAQWEARHPVLRRHTIKVAPRPGFTGITALHVSDLHMFPGQDFIEDFIARIASEETFDLVISTGDNLGDKTGIDGLMRAYAPLLDYPGAFVLGSNDYYSPQTRSWLRYLERNRHVHATRRHQESRPDLPWLRLVHELLAAGWLDMSNRGDQMHVPTSAGKQTIALMGVDDPHIHRDRFPAKPEAWSDESALRLGLTHSPYLRVINSFVEADTDVIFAGHTHGGQVRIPGIGSVVTNCDLPREASRGVTKWVSPNSDFVSKLDVSAGLGTSPFAPIRFACRPEASLVTIIPADE